MSPVAAIVLGAGILLVAACAGACWLAWYAAEIDADQNREAHADELAKRRRSRNHPRIR